MEELKKDVETVKLMTNPQNFLGKIPDLNSVDNNNEQEENEEHHLSTS
jgi:hypothetical protein